MTPFSGPFTVAQARSAGLPQAKIHGSDYVRLFHGIYAPAGAIDLRLRCEGARLLLPDDAVATGRTALRLRGLDLGADLPVTFVTRQPVRMRHSGINLRTVAEVPECTGWIAQASEACAFLLDSEALVPAVTAVDRALHRGLMTRSDILAAPLTTRARRAFAHVAVGAHSARESKLRLALTLAGLPRPETQGRIEADGTLVAQVDLLYRYYRVALEYEGGQHLTDPDQWQKDITRYADLVRVGFTVVRVTSTRMRKPDDVVNEVFRGLVDHGYAGPAPRFSPSWWAAVS